MKVFGIVLVIVFVSSVTLADCKNKKNTCKAKAIDTCPLQGCGGDPLLNRRKNITTRPSANDVQKYTRANFNKLTLPASWARGTPRGLLKKWGEGTPIELEAFLIDLTNYSCGMEATNCNLHGNENNDFHLVTVSKQNLHPNDSITAEITPRLRPQGWTLTKLRKLVKDKAYIKVTGYLMLDTEHIGDAKPVRLTHWEIHPVTNLQVCVGSVTRCKSGEDWQDLSKFPEP